MSLSKMAASFGSFVALGSGNHPTGQDHDANSALMELDKGLRSGKAGEQCEAIVKFPRLLERYPFPILINSAFLKLADVFRVGTNFLRLWVLRVIQQSEKYLDKILNIDEFLRRICMVIHSNDPVARAITLRTLGSIAGIIPERKNAHHSVLNGLDSNDSVEQEAAILAAADFAAQSKTFCNSVCGKLANMIQGLATPVETKLKLIQIFQHMHHDIHTATKVRSLCIELLPRYPARNFVTTTLCTLTKLASHTLVDTSAQIELLLQYLVEDPRRSVKIESLKNLKTLAKNRPHVWSQHNVQGLVEFCHLMPSEELMLGGLHTLAALSSSVAVTSFSTNEDVFHPWCYHSNLSIASMACEIMTNICIHKTQRKENCAELIEAVRCMLESLMLSSCIDDTSRKPSKLCLKAIVKLCQSCPETTIKFVQAVTNVLSLVQGGSSEWLCQCLAAIGSHQPAAIEAVLHDIISTFNAHAETQDDNFKVYLATVLLQTCNDNLGSDVKTAIYGACDTLHGWNLYKLGRQAARYGHHDIAAHMWEVLYSQVSSECYLFWFQSLNAICLAEHILLCDPNNSLTDAISHYQRGLSSLKAASTPDHTLVFQCEYVKLRVMTLQAHFELNQVCHSFATNPPPAIAASIAQSTGKEIHKCGHAVIGLQKCSGQFQNISSLYDNLYQTLFDADPASLKKIKLLQECCSFMAQIIDRLLSSKPHRNESSLICNEIRMEQVKKEGNRLLQQADQFTANLALNYMHIECLRKTSSMLVEWPLYFPRYFFQTLQNTVIKLAVTPQPKSSEPVLLERGTHFTLKVEGIVQHGNKTGLHRNIKQVCIGVRSALQSRLPLPKDAKVPECPTNVLSQFAEPHNDYLTTQFLMSFPVPGLHIVNIEASVVDEHDLMWKTGPLTSIMIKSYDEQVKVQQQLQQAGQSKHFVLTQQKSGN